MRRFAGKTILITGGGNGIGRATARRLAEEGGRILILDRDGDAAGRVVGELAGQDHAAIAADIGNKEQVARALIEARRLAERIDVLVNNAAFTAAGRFEELDEAGFAEEVRITLEGAYWMTRGVLPAMVEARGGAIVAVASVNGIMYFGNPAYSAAKAGLISFMRSVAVAYGSAGIRANIVSPGTVNTMNRSWRRRMERDPRIVEKLEKWYPVGRVGRAEDIAAAIAFLAADEAAFVNGANLVVDGGLTAGIVPMVEEITGGLR